MNPTVIQHYKARRAAFYVAGAAVVLIAMAAFVAHRLGKLAMPLDALNGSSFFVADESQKTGDPSKLPVLAGAMPEFAEVQAWLNSDPLTAAQLKGKVVLVDFWTYSCINCIRTFPYLTSWYEKYKDKGFVIVGVHTPEFAFEKSESNVRRAMARYGITYPVALDNEYGTWNAYANRYWPAHYLFDAKGQLRETHFGEGNYEETEMAIQSLLKEAGTDASMGVTAESGGVDYRKIGTPETYIGYARQEHFGSPETVQRDAVAGYSVPEPLSQNLFALQGAWRIEEERAVLAAPGGFIVNRYTAANANLVMGAPTKVRTEVTLDGEPVPADRRGDDVYELDGKTYVDVEEQRLYDLIDTRGEYGTHVLRLQFDGTDVECYAYTFG